MSRRRKTVIGIVCCVVLLPVLTYCLLKFSFGIDTLDRSGWNTKEAGVRYLDYYGRPQLQWQTIEGKTYYFDPEDGYLVTGWLDLDDQRYYFDEAGCLVTGWQEMEGQRYYFDETGCMITGWLELDGKRYYLDKTGAAVSGWQNLEEKQRYFDTTGALVVGWLKLETEVYYLDAEGVPVTGWTDIEQSRYFFDDSGIMATGWLEYENDRYYLREDGTMAVGEVILDGVSYFFTSAGKYVIMVNQWHLMPEDYKPDLVEIEGFQVDSSCRDALRQMLQDCRAAGYRCEINNTYRSVATQESLWDAQIERRTAAGMTYEEAVSYTGQRLALPGASEHHLGLAADILGSDPMFAWLEAHCWDYGFILRYPDDRVDVTGIIYEPWHFRYVGVELAKELQALGLCMEEYMDMLTQSQIDGQ